VSAAFRPCILIPTYNNPRTIRDVVERVRGFHTDVIVVNDCSGPEGRVAVEAIGRDGLAHVHHRAVNGGKGAAVKTGFQQAKELGFTHALQVDADGQHNLTDIPVFLEAARTNPDAAVLGYPIYDKTVPMGRLIGRQITLFWTHFETGGFRIRDPMCGFRVYPLDRSIGIRSGDRMDFDIEIAVRLVWAGTRIVNLPTKVRYLTAEEGGVSHFHMFSDNLKISGMHTRLAIGAIGRAFTWPVRALRGSAP
jgi:glycosyltransferase involved in cell wall biosynthesis